MYVMSFWATASRHIYIISFGQQKAEFGEFWEKHKNCPLTARNQILASLCPQVYGLYVVKLAVTLALTGGVQVLKLTNLWSLSSNNYNVFIIIKYCVVLNTV